jgi:hypothetical protein
MHEIHFLDSTTKYKTFHFFTKVNYKIELLFENNLNHFQLFHNELVRKFRFELYFSTLPHSEEGILHQSKSVSECFKLPFFQGPGQNVSYLLICGNILELHYFLLNPILYEVILDLYVLRLVMKQWILREFDTTLIIIVNDCRFKLLIKQSCK